jgi:hypothetical protein
MKLIKTLPAAIDYVRCHAWPWWTVGGLACAALCVSRAGLRDSIRDHAGVALLLLLPVLLVARLVTGADDAREKLRCGPSCRRS